MVMSPNVIIIFKITLSMVNVLEKVSKIFAIYNEICASLLIEICCKTWFVRHKCDECIILYLIKDNCLQIGSNIVINSKFPNLV